MKEGWTKDEFESTLYYKPSFFRKRVKRICFAAKQTVLSNQGSICHFWEQN
jgi:hypothetical protein